jgi:CheY-like chemotaxis protein
MRAGSRLASSYRSSRREGDDVSGKSARLDGLRVLIVEDELFPAMELESLLEELGCVALTPAPTIKRALCVVGCQRPDVAVLDVNLKGERVTPVAEVLREKGVPFVLVTGYRTESLPDRALLDTPCLQKPVDGRQLASALFNAVARLERGNSVRANVVVLVSLPLSASRTAGQGSAIGAASSPVPALSTWRDHASPASSAPPPAPSALPSRAEASSPRRSPRCGSAPPRARSRPAGAPSSSIPDPCPRCRSGRTRTEAASASTADPKFPLARGTFPRDHVFFAYATEPLQLAPRWRLRSGLARSCPGRRVGPPRSVRPRLTHCASDRGAVEGLATARCRGGGLARSDRRVGWRSTRSVRSSSSGADAIEIEQGPAVADVLAHGVDRVRHAVDLALGLAHVGSP